MCPFQMPQICQGAKAQITVHSTLASFLESPSWQQVLNLSANHDSNNDLFQRTNRRRRDLNILRGPFQLLVKSHAQGVFDPSDRLQMLAYYQTVGCSLKVHHL